MDNHKNLCDLHVRTPPASRGPSSDGEPTFESNQGTQGQRLQPPKLYCPASGCKNVTGFSNPKDLRRHEKDHIPGARKWHCGCCINLGEFLDGLTRKDKLQAHMRRNHSLPPPNNEYLGLQCREDGCDEWTLFATESCLLEHSRQVHSATVGQQVNHGTRSICTSR